MNVIKIDGVAYDVLVVDLSENFNILYSENTGRTMSTGARMVLDPLGTFYGHNVTFKRKADHEAEFDALYSYLSSPKRDGFAVEIIHNQETIAYDAYVSSGGRALKKYDAKNGKAFWDVFSVNFIPMEAQITSE